MKVAINYFVLLLSAIMFTSWVSNPNFGRCSIQTTDSIRKNGIFTCTINDKPFVIEGITASMRKITGGEKQLSLSNDRFIKFTFFNPSEKNIDLSKKGREAYIRYEDPATRQVAFPIQGYVQLKEIDEEKGIVSGNFEIELVVVERDKKRIIKVKQGKFENVPIVYK